VAIVAACGAAVPQLSGRGLGHTGGTLDKMESIPGWRATLSPGEMAAMLRDVGCFIAAPSADLAPADRKIYALRDVTATVESIPLIASSIMSKKIAEGTSGLVLDVKVGSGTFMRDEARARELAETMVRLGVAAGVRTRALLTDMNEPLGRVAGNALEVAQAETLLRGENSAPQDLLEIVLELARQMLDVAGLDADPAAVIADGRAYATWQAMVLAQGGNPLAALPCAAHVDVVRADRSGVLTRLDARGVGVAAWRLGAGRSRKEDPISAGAGVRWLAGVGEPVRSGQVLFELHTDDPSRVASARGALQNAWEIGDGPSPGRPRRLVVGRVGEAGGAAHPVGSAGG
jgi:thymidine phosphorylase